MEFLLLFLLCIAPVTHNRCIPYDIVTHNVVGVVDGDTLTVRFPELLEPLGPTLRLRLRHIDAPEIFHPHCDEERVLGFIRGMVIGGTPSDAPEAKNLVQEMVMFGVASVSICGWDKCPYIHRRSVGVCASTGDAFRVMFSLPPLTTPYLWRMPCCRPVWPFLTMDVVVDKETFGGATQPILHHALHHHNAYMICRKTFFLCFYVNLLLKTPPPLRQTVAGEEQSNKKKRMPHPTAVMQLTLSASFSSRRPYSTGQTPVYLPFSRW